MVGGMTCDWCGKELDQHKDRYVIRFQSVPIYRDTNREAYDMCVECTERLRGELRRKRKKEEEEGRGMKLLDFKDNAIEVPVNLDDPNIEHAYMFVLSGDEILTVEYKDGGIEGYDTGASTRMTDYFDGAYTIVSCGKWKVDKDVFLARTSSYWFDGM